MQKSLCATYRENNYRYLKILIELGTYKCQALVDSRVQGNFISPGIVNKYYLYWNRKKEPYRLNAVDETAVAYSNGIINKETDPLLVQIGNYTEQLTFNITKMVEYQLILEIPWLKKNNLWIDQTTGQIYWANPVNLVTGTINTLQDKQSLVSKDSTRQHA